MPENPFPSLEAARHLPPLLLVVLLSFAPWAVQGQGSCTVLRCSESGIAVPLMAALGTMYAAPQPQSCGFSFVSVTGSATVTNVVQSITDFSVGFVAPTEQQYNSGKSLQLLPLFVTPVVIGYNLPNAVGSLVLSPELLASIWAGDVTMWNDTAIAALNGGLNLP
eukprot:RCo017038